VHFSNELVDAFPVHRVRWTGERWVERHVTWDGKAFLFIDGETGSEQLRQCMKKLPRNVAPGFETEVNLDARRWVHAVAEKLVRGWLLVIDYGHAAVDLFHPRRASGTLAAYREHRRCDDLLAEPGEQDLTAHVNFTALAKEGITAGLEFQGFTDQHHFMVGLSQLHFHDSDEITTRKQRELLAFKTLMHPGLLGMNFRALCLRKGAPGSKALSGFSLAPSGLAALGLD
jgi:SAM-dependent MidA family methyltransferase